MPWMFWRVAFMIVFGNLCRMTMPILQSGVHTNGKEWTCLDIPTVGSLHAQIQTVHTLSAQFLPVLSYTFSRLLVLGVQLSVRTPDRPQLCENFLQV